MQKAETPRPYCAHLVLACLVTLTACAQSAPKVTFSGPDYITIKHDPVLHGPPPHDVMVMAEEYCAKAGKSAAITPYGRYKNSTAFICVAEGEKVK